MKSYLDVANGNIMFILCAIPIIIVLIQSIIFIRLGIKRTKDLGMEEGTVKKLTANSIISSIVPSLPIIISLAVLMPSLGKYLPWMRLSVIGSMMYESMCADIVIKEMGYAGGLQDAAGITTAVFASVVWVMCVASIAWPLSNAIGLKTYDKKLTSMQKSGGFMVVATGALFIGLMAVMAFPRVLDIENKVGIIVIIVSGVAAILLEFISKKTKIKALSEFSFPIAMLLGMASAIVVNGMV
ncbi:DUF5058 family protein [Miniphocaeibacter massiliensis]|uniref:DUF5058 family protein n=1 Tax=Miniphocaeibacter massiliensis TaxID=2041841 RepID=UPI000C1BA1D4|nr:DUF5058 family protein [Miniphocaeibacter massiliensis]